MPQLRLVEMFMTARAPAPGIRAQEERRDPGGKVKLKLPQHVSGTAIFSTCRQYRHLLTRDWQTPLWKDLRDALWIGMNPSTADAEYDDTTIRREIYFTMRLGFSRLVMANVMNYRATHPKDLLSSPAPCSNENLPHIVNAAKDAALIIVAWGSLPPALRPYAQAAENAVRAIDPPQPMFCLGFTKDGAPRHPLYVRAAAPLVPFPSSADAASCLSSSVRRSSGRSGAIQKSE